MNTKKYFLNLISFAIFIVCFNFSTNAAMVPPASTSISLAWNSSGDPTVAGYAIYYGNSSGNYVTRVDVGNQNNATITGLDVKQNYFFVATAYNRDGLESLSSNEAALLAPTIASLQRPSGNNPAKIDFIASLKSTQLQASEDLMNWTTIFETSNVTNQSIQFIDTNSTSSGSRFYRLIFQ